MATGMLGWRAGRHRLDQAGRWLRSRPLVLDSLIAGAVAGPFAVRSLYTLVAARSAWPVAPWLTVVVGLAVLMEPVALAFRRVAPLASFVAVSAASLVQTAVPGVPPVLPSLAAFPLSLFAYCAYGRGSAPAWGLAVAVAGAGVVTAQLVLDGQAATMPLIEVFGSLLAIALVAWSLGLFRRVQLAYVVALEERTTRAEAEREERARRAVMDERARIAREMHDVIAHSLAVIVSQAQGGQYVARANPERATAVLATITQAGRQALADMRGLLGVLRPDAPPANEESWGPQPTLRDLPELLERVRSAGLPVRYSATGSMRQLGPAAELALYRLVQEALTNTFKHAGPGASAAVRFAWTEDGVTVTASDDGRGRAPSDGGGHGLIGMRERLAVVGGSVAAGPGPEGGFVVQARLPHRTEACEEVGA